MLAWAAEEAVEMLLVLEALEPMVQVSVQAAAAAARA